MFSEVLTREEWLKLFDNVFSNRPSFLLMTVVAYNICSRAPLLSCKAEDNKKKKKIFCMIRDKVDVGDVIEMKINHSFYPPQIVICLMTSVFFALI